MGPLGYFLFLCLLESSLGDLRLLNDEIDRVVDNVSEEIQRNSNDKLRISDIWESFSFSRLFVKIESSLHCVDGELRDLSTLRRTGGVVIRKVDITEADDLVVLVVPMHLAHFDLSYRSCRIEMNHLGRETEKADFHFNLNALQMNVTVAGRGARCASRIGSLGVGRAERISMDTDNRLMNLADSSVKEVVMEFINFRLKEPVIDRLERVLAYHLRKSDLCKLINK